MVIHSKRHEVCPPSLSGRDRAAHAGGGRPGGPGYHGAMASWTDGPEYAPRVRPDAFVAPDAAPLAGPAEPAATPPGPAAAERPEFGEPPDAPALAGLGVPAGELRDPATPFAAVTTPLTAVPAGPVGAPTQPLVLSTAPLDPYEAAPGSTTGQLPEARWEPPRSVPVGPGVPPGSAWGAAHAPHGPARPGHDAWAPQQPFALPAPPAMDPGVPVGPAPHPNPRGFAPPGAPWLGAAPRPPAPPVTLRALWRAANPVLLTALLVAAVAPWVGLDALTPLAFAAALYLAHSASYRRRLVARAHNGVAVLAAVMGVLGWLEGRPLWSAWDVAVGWLQAGSAVLLVVVLVLVGGALRRGDAPEA